MKRYICSLLTLFVITFSYTVIHAQADVSTDAKVNYKVTEDGMTEVDYQISLKNIFTDRYAKSYTLQLQGTSPERISITENGNPLEFSTETEGQTKKVTVNFPDAVVGKDAVRLFNINYIDSSFASQNGEVWDISIPRLGSPENFRSYDVTLEVPISFGQPAYIFPFPRESSSTIYTFSKDDISSTGIHGAFGEFQAYEMSLKYQLENPIHQNTSVDIALPPDTSYQKIYLQNIDPVPSKLESDEDGNWIASYDLKARQQLEVNVKTVAQVFNSPIQKVEITEAVKEANMQPTSNWQVNDQQIQKIAQEYNSAEEIYNYVIETLEYNHSRIEPNAERLGAVAALESPKDALCTEFTDLFVTIARAAGIPSREVNGYAYSDNATLQPLSLVTDVLHSWPEYWDEQRHAWIAVDPTWGDTTGGVDYFHNMDLNHIAFAIHGKSDTFPYPAGSYKLGAYPEKNVEVKIGVVPSEKDNKPRITVKPKGGFPIFSQVYEVAITNSGQIALYDSSIKVKAGNINQTWNIEALLPFGAYTGNLQIPVGIFAMNMPSNITVEYANTDHNFTTQKIDISVHHSAFLLLIILAITVGVVIYLSPNIKILRKIWRR